MNRSSLFGRLTASVHANRASHGHDYFRVHLEPLEQRQLLTTSPVYVNDNWVNLSNPGVAPSFGDLVTNSLDSIDTGNITVLYGIAGFGATVDGTAAGVGLIHDAIQGTDAGGTLNVLEGTYAESDIVIDRALLFKGAGDTGAARSLIVPEVTSSHSDITNFGVGTRQGIIIYSASVTVTGVALDGNGNGSVPGTLNYHQGITTLYDTQNGGNYNSLHNGSLPLIQLGPLASANRSIPNLLIDNVTVENVFYHGITLSALGGQQFGQSTTSLSVDNAVVNNVGDVGNQDVSRVGILIQNLDNNPFDAPNNGNVRFSTVSNAGVGIMSNAFGNKTYASQNGARNLTGMVFNTVNNAVLRAYHIEFNDGGESYINNIANFSPGNNATGVYINHSRIAANSFVINGAKIGVHIQNNSENAIGGNDIPTLFLANVLTGPGTGVAGSIGVLVDNSVTETESSTVLLAANTRITNYETGVRAVQNVAPGDGLRTTVLLADPTFGTLGTGISLGDGVTLRGSDPSPSLVTTGSASIEPWFSNWNNYYSLAPGADPLINPDPKADVISTGNTTFGAAATFAPLITGESGTTPLFNFNAAVNYPFSAPPANPENGITNVPYGVLFNWFGQITQNGNGEFFIGGSATNGHGLDYAFGSKNTPTGTFNNANQPLYQLIPTDISNRTTLNIVAKLGATNQAQTFAIGLFDMAGNANLWAFDSSLLNSTAFTTLTVNLLAPSIDLTGPNDRMDITRIAGYVFGNDEGTINGNQEVPFSLHVDDISTASLANSKLAVTGTVNLGGAALGATIRPSFVPTLTQQFTILENDGVDAITGTFAGVAQNSYVTISGLTYKVNYSGGTGNDVVLTRENFVPPGASVVGRHLFYNQSGTPSPLRYDGNNLAINANDDLAIATNKSAYLPGSGAATFANVSSYTKGINGIMVDIAGTHGTITAADFIFRVGNNNTPNSWVAAPAPNSISVRAGAGVSGSDRVVLTWANGAITKKWLEVIVLANANTGLSQKVGYPVGQGDVFFFGNAVANSGSGDNATQAIVNVTDELGARNNPAGVLTNIPVTNLFDYNRDGAVNTTDALAARNNPTNTGNVVRYISVANPPAAPEASPAADDGGVASALSTASAGGALSSAGVPRWLVNRLQNVDLNSGPIARFFEHLADQNTPGTRKILVAADKVADELGLEHDLLESLLEDLGL